MTYLFFSGIDTKGYLMLLIDNELITVFYQEEAKIVHHTIHHTCVGKTLRDALTRGAEIFEQYGAEKWLSDDRNNGGLDEEDPKYGREVWSKRMVEAGWKYWALVLPRDVPGTHSMAQLIDAYSQMGVTVKLFSNPDTALDWLKEQ
jgi:hypothetical protein